VSLSPSFWTPSAQVAGWQRPAVHTPFSQSRPRLQPLPDAQRAEQLPPQSTSVSSPFWSWSVQLGSTQRAFVHTADSQSRPLWHAPPSLQGAQIVPPQSMSLSLPFFSRSLQVDGRAPSGASPEFPESTTASARSAYSGKLHAAATAIAASIAHERRSGNPITVMLTVRQFV